MATGESDAIATHTEPRPANRPIDPAHILRSHEHETHEGPLPGQPSCWLGHRPLVVMNALDSNRRGRPTQTDDGRIVSGRFADS